MEKKDTIVYGYDNVEKRWEVNLVDKKDNVIDCIFAESDEELEVAIDKMKKTYDVADDDVSLYLDDLNGDRTVEMTEKDLIFDHSNDLSMKEKSDKNFAHETTEEEMKNTTVVTEESEKILAGAIPEIPVNTLDSVYNTIYIFTIIFAILEGIGTFVLAIKISPIYFLFGILAILFTVLMWKIFSAFFGLLYDVKAIRHHFENKNND